MSDPRTSRPRLGVLVALAVFLGLVAALAIALTLDDEPEHPLVGQPAPVISAPLSSGVVPQDDYVLNVWATWCTPCIAEHPVLMQSAARGTAIVGIAYNDEPEKVATYLARAGNPFSALYFDDGSVTADWGLRGVPETFVVEDGIITAHHSGALERPITLD